jgi:hypothetical protein
LHSSLIVLQKQKTQKLTKTSENNKAKGLTSANQGVQIHNIWHSSPDIRQTSIICPDDMLLPSGHLHHIEKLLYQPAPSERFSSTSGRLPVLERFTDSFQVSRKGRSINRPDDVVSHPDAYLRKARIAFQNGPSGRLTAVVRTLVHRIW